MRDTATRDMRSRFRFIVCFLGLFSSLPVSAQDVYLCVWRNPERTMTRIFPDARDYKTITVEISPDQRKIIEEKIGHALLPGQQDRFQYFDMTGDKGQVIGRIIPSTQKGEYGAVEFVFGIDNAGTIKDIYVQRARERDQTFKERAFLDLFVGRSIRESGNFDDLGTGDSTPGTEAVVRGVVKELVCYEALVLTEGKATRN